MRPGRTVRAPPAPALPRLPGPLTLLAPTAGPSADRGSTKRVPSPGGTPNRVSFLCRTLTRPRRLRVLPEGLDPNGRPSHSPGGSARRRRRARPPCPPEAPHIAVLVGEVAARLAAAVLEVGEAAAVEEGGPLAAPGALEGLHEAVVEAVVARAHPARLAHRERLRTGPRETPDLPSDPLTPLGPGSSPAIPSLSDGEAFSLRAPPLRSLLPLSTWWLVALLALLSRASEWPLYLPVFDPVPLLLCPFVGFLHAPLTPPASPHFLDSPRSSAGLTVGQRFRPKAKWRCHICLPCGQTQPQLPFCLPKDRAGEFQANREGPGGAFTPPGAADPRSCVVGRKKKH